MHVFLKLAMSWLKPGGDPDIRRSAPETLVTIVLLLVIGFVAGPDLIAYIELSTLLELLGASLFIFSFAAGMRIYSIEISTWFRRCIVSDAGAAFLHIKAPRFLAFGSALIIRNSVVLLTYLVLPVCGMIVIGHSFLI